MFQLFVPGVASEFRASHINIVICCLLHCFARWWEYFAEDYGFLLGGGVQRDLLESDVQNDIANDVNVCSFTLG